MGAAAARCQGGTSAGMEALRVKATTLLGEVVWVRSPGQQWVGCPCPKNSEVLRDELHFRALWEREGTKDTGCPT